MITESLVCTFLLDIEQADIGNDNPLSQFQGTKNSKEDVLELLKTINKAYGKEKLDDEILEPTFEKWWPDFETKISSIPSQKKDGEFPVRKESELLAEILETVRNIERKSGEPIRIIDASGNIFTSGTLSKVAYSLPLFDVQHQQDELELSSERLKSLLKKMKQADLNSKDKLTSENLESLKKFKK